MNIVQTPAPTATDGGMSSGKGTIGCLAVTSIGIGGMVGGGIFAVLGLAVTLVCSGTPIAFALAGIVAALTAYFYAKLSVRYPSEGGTVTFLNQAFGTGRITWITFLSYIKDSGGTGGMYGLTYRVQIEAAERLVEEGIRLDRIDADLTLAKGFGIFYLYDYLDQNLPSGRDYSEKKARVINTYLHPDEGCEFSERSAELPPPGPLRICISSLQ